MNPSYEAIPANCSLRRARAEDDEFLRRLFAETQDSIQAFRMNPVLFQQLAEMQYHGRRQSYQAEHPQSVDTILCVHTEEVGELPVGRLLVDCRPDCWRVVDIALLPGYQRKGLGGWALALCMHKCGEEAGRIKLSVRPGNPARRLYERLGFRLIHGDLLTVEMEATVRRSAAALPREMSEAALVQQTIACVPRGTIGHSSQTGSMQLS